MRPKKKRLQRRWRLAAVGCASFLLVGVLVVVGLRPEAALGIGALLGSMWAGLLELIYGIGENSKKTKLAELLAANHGRVTVFELASKIGGDLDGARALLEDAVTRPDAELLLADNGTEVFSFRGVLTPRQLAEARSIDSILLERDNENRRS